MYVMLLLAVFLTHRYSHYSYIILDLVPTFVAFQRCVLQVVGVVSMIVLTNRSQYE